jgi:TRAP-type uncharacterized transport system substrate-binding protein
MKLPKARVLRVMAAVLPAIGLAAAILIIVARVPQTLVMATGPAGSAYALYGEQYRLLLARSGVTVRLRPSGGTEDNLRLLNDRAAGINVSFLSAGTTSAKESPDLRTLGTVFMEEVWFFSRDPDLLRGDWAALRGKRISIGPEGSVTRSVAESLLRQMRIDPTSPGFVGLAPQAAAEQLRRGDIQAAVFMTSADMPVVRDLLADPAIDLVGFRRTAAYVALHSFMTQLTVPEGVGDLALNRPPNDVATVGAPVSLAVRSDMHPALQALLLKAASQIHGGSGMFNTAGRFPAAEAIDLPLSDEALQYYKAGTPFLQRYLPFGIAVLVGELLFVVVPVLGVLYPVFTLAPGVYGWAIRMRIFHLYGELKILEFELSSDPSGERKLAVRDRVEQLDRRVARMRFPNAYAHLVYGLRLHINLVRSRL